MKKALLTLLLLWPVLLLAQVTIQPVPKRIYWSSTQLIIGNATTGAVEGSFVAGLDGILIYGYGSNLVAVQIGRGTDFYRPTDVLNSSGTTYGSSVSAVVGGIAATYSTSNGVTSTTIASQAEAVGKTDNTKMMTPLRVAQALATINSSTLVNPTVTGLLSTSAITIGGQITNTWAGSTATDNVLLRTTGAGTFNSIGFYDTGGSQVASFGFSNAGATSYANSFFLNTAAGKTINLGINGSAIATLSSTSSILNSTRIQLGNTAIPGGLWSSYTNAWQFGNASMYDYQVSQSNEFDITANWYFNGGNSVYTKNGYAGSIQFNPTGGTGGIILGVASSGSAGATITPKSVTISPLGGGALGAFTAIPSSLNNSNPFFFLGQSFVVAAATSTNDNYIFNNIYSNGTNNVYKNTGFGSYLGFLNNGDIVLGSAPSGTVGTTVTSSQRFALSSNGNVLLGNNTSVGSSDPVTLDLGGTYSSTGGQNAKLKITNDGTNVFGIGVSPTQVDYIMPSGGTNTHSFYIGTTKHVAIGNNSIAIGTSIPNPVDASTRYLFINSNGSLTSSAGGTYMVWNSYYNGTNSVAQSTGAASYIATNSTGWEIASASSVTAGSTQTFTKRLRGDLVGNVAQNTTLPGTLSSSNTSHFIGQPLNIVAGVAANYSAFQNNAYNNGTNDVRKNAGYTADLFFDINGNVNIRTAGTSTAGSSITWNTPLIINNNGSTLVSSTTTNASIFSVGDGSSYPFTVDRNGRVYTGSFAGTYSTYDASFAIGSKSGGTGVPTLVVRGIASQTSDLLQIQNSTPTTLFSVNSTGSIKFAATNTATGTTGAQTINNATGTVNFAPGASTLVVTNSLVSTSSIVLAVIRTNDSTATIKNVVPSSGSFTINLGASATAETSVAFFVFN